MGAGEDMTEWFDGVDISKGRLACVLVWNVVDDMSSTEVVIVIVMRVKYPWSERIALCLS